MSRDRLKFYLIRLKKASGAEVLYRLRERLIIFFLKLFPKTGLRLSKPPAVSLEKIQKIHFPDLSGNSDLDFIKSLLNGKLFVLNQDQDQIKNFEERWRNSFFADVPMNQPEPDIRAVWEPARLQHLTILLHQLKLTDNPAEREVIKSFVKKSLLDWLDRNPFLFGPHYLSVMECALRIPVFLLALKTLDNLSPSDQARLIEAMYRHAWITRKRLSLYSSFGNHTVAEAVGLIFAGAVFQAAKQGREWLNTGTKLLKETSRQQIQDDGGPGEQSFGYLRFVLDLYWFVVDFMEKNDLYDGNGLKGRLELGEKFLRAFTATDGTRPQLGDSDGGHALGPGLSPRWRRRPEPSRGTEQLSFQEFPESGCTVIRGPDDMLMTFDHGPLGAAPLYNHGHADALSITLSVKGVPFLVDSGTYRYNGAPGWRRYFKGTRAHNTVAVDGLDQAEQVTGFIWDKPYRVEWSRHAAEDGSVIIKASHDGYSRLPDPVIHTRSLRFIGADLLVIKDTFNGRGSHEFELNFHLHPEVKITKLDDWNILKLREKSIFIKLREQECDMVRGVLDPLLGWYAADYGQICETSVLRARRKAEPEETVFTAVICFNKPITEQDIERITL